MNRLIAFVVIVIVLGMMLGPLKTFSSASETIVNGIAGREDWMVLIFKLIPIALPAAIIVVALTYLIKGKKKTED